MLHLLETRQASRWLEAVPSKSFIQMSSNFTQSFVFLLDEVGKIQKFRNFILREGLSFFFNKLSYFALQLHFVILCTCRIMYFLCHYRGFKICLSLSLKSFSRQKPLKSRKQKHKILGDKLFICLSSIG